jgi:signal transduction histidine kinase
VVRRAAARLEREFAAANIELTIDDGCEPVMGRWERCRLEGLCSHLLSNSIKFGAGQPVAVTVRADATHAHVTVALRRHVEMETDPDLVFEELRKRETAAGSLSGGLWAVRHLATAMGGTVAVRGEAGHGSACTVTLPRHDG